MSTGSNLGEFTQGGGTLDVVTSTAPPYGAPSARSATTLQGSIDAMPLDDLMRLLATSGRNGRLVVRPEQPLWLQVRDGRVVLGGSSSAMTLGRHLLARGAVSAEQLEEWFSLSEVAQGRITLHALDVLATLERLAEAGEIPLDELERAVFDAATSTVAEMLGLAPTDHQGTPIAFVFSEADPPVPLRGADFDMERVVDEARRLAELRVRLERRLGGPDRRFRRRSRIAASSTPVTLGAQEWAALAEIDDRATIAQVSHRIGLGLASTYELLDRFVGSGLIEPA